MPETKPITETKVEQVSIDDLDNLLGTPGAEAVMVPGEGAEPTKPTFFQKEKVDLKFIDDEPTDPPTDPDPAPADPAPADPADPQDPPADPDPAPAAPEGGAFDKLAAELEGGDPADPKGRPKLDKTGMAQLTQALIDDKVILPFDDDKKLEEYTVDDFKELFKMNSENEKTRIAAETPKEFFDALPQELQYAAQYVADGGQDLKGLFRTLASAEETKSISLESDQGQEHAVRQFLQATSFGSTDEIQEQIDSWKDLDQLEGKAKQFKPKLDAMQETIVKRQLAEQQAKQQQREQQSLQYAESVYATLAEGKLGDVTLNNKVQNMLYQGLIQPNYQSISGQPTNMFGHLIEKHQYVEPNHELMAETLWLMADPEGYKENIRKSAKNEAAAETARKLKIEQQSKKPTSGQNPEPGGDRKAGVLKRPDKNFFKRGKE